ncbi:MAG: hypothetical protein ACI89L_001580 [Phycisphaerales bacterium]|jgi:hypothetical protein
MASRKPHAKFFTSLALMGALAGVLIWSKLRLSTNMPRSAYADPRELQVDESDTPDAVSEPGAMGTHDAVNPAVNPAVRPESDESEPGESAEFRDDG